MYPHKNTKIFMWKTQTRKNHGEILTHNIYNNYLHWFRPKARELTALDLQTKVQNLRQDTKEGLAQLKSTFSRQDTKELFIYNMNNKFEL